MKQTKLQMTGSFFGVNSCYAALDVTIAWDQALEWGGKEGKNWQGQRLARLSCQFFQPFFPPTGELDPRLTSRRR